MQTNKNHWYHHAGPEGRITCQSCQLEWISSEPTPCVCGVKKTEKVVEPEPECDSVAGLLALDGRGMQLGLANMWLELMESDCAPTQKAHHLVRLAGAIRSLQVDGQADARANRYEEIVEAVEKD